MEPAQSGSFSFSDNGSSKQEKPKKSNKIFKTLKKIIVKFWYVFSILIVLVAAIIVWSVLQSNQAAAWDEASDHFKNARYEEAEKIIKDFPVPSEPEKQRVYAQTMLATGNLDKALAGYEKLYASTNDVSSKLFIGNIYNEKKEYDKAIDIYKEVIADNPGNVQAYVNVATVYRLQGKNAEAISIAKQAVEANPQNVTLLELKVSMLLEDQESAEFQEAVAQLREVNPNDPLLQSLAAQQ